MASHIRYFCLILMFFLAHSVRAIEASKNYSYSFSAEQTKYLEKRNELALLRYINAYGFLPISVYPYAKTSMGVGLSLPVTSITDFQINVSLISIEQDYIKQLFTSKLRIYFPWFGTNLGVGFSRYRITDGDNSVRWILCPSFSAGSFLGNFFSTAVLTDWIAIEGGDIFFLRLNFIFDGLIP